MSRSALIEIDKSELKFSSGHFMVYNDSEREHMHGHDYQVSAAFNTTFESNGMAFDIRLYKKRLLDICQTLDYHFLLPSQSEFMRVEDKSDHYLCHHANKQMRFSKEDAILLPISNLTLEDLSHWILQQFLANPTEIESFGIQGIRIRVHNGRGEAGGTTWGHI